MNRVESRRHTFRESGNLLKARAFCFLALFVLPVLVSVGCGDRKEQAQAKLLNELADVGARIEYDDQQLPIFINLSDTSCDNEILGAIVKLDSIEKLWLADTNVTDEGMKSVAQLENLKVLVLSNTYVSNGGLNHLGSLESLRELYLDGTRVNKNGVEKLNEQIPELSIVY